MFLFVHSPAAGGFSSRARRAKNRAERVQQALDGENSVHDFTAYVPIGSAVRKLRSWQAQGAEIVYLSSHKRVEDVEKNARVLRAYGFPDGQIFFRQGGEGYPNVAERVLPDILIEDDCENIGREKEMTYPHIRAELKTRIKSIVVQEFGGLDHLPDEIAALFEML